VDGLWMVCGWFVDVGGVGGVGGVGEMVRARME
jgi:hypothetical protein